MSLNFALSQCILTKAGMKVSMEVIAIATLAAEAETVIVSAVTQKANVLAAPVVSAARVHHCETPQMWK